jgi:hypothetical protein
MAWTYTMVCVAWVFFRAESVWEAVGYIGSMLSFQSGITLDARGLIASSPIFAALLIDWIIHKDGLDVFQRKWYAMPLAAIGFLCILLCWQEESTQFIYFQF